MDIEDTLNENNLKKYYDFTESFHNIFNSALTTTIFLYNHTQ
jgi:hypothetical protein